MAEHGVTDRSCSVVTNADTASCRTLKPRLAIRHERFVGRPQWVTYLYERLIRLPKVNISRANVAIPVNASMLVNVWVRGVEAVN